MPLQPTKHEHALFFFSPSPPQNGAPLVFNLLQDAQRHRFHPSQLFCSPSPTQNATVSFVFNLFRFLNFHCSGMLLFGNHFGFPLISHNPNQTMILFFIFY
jgi:hypothetical protein